MISRGRVKAVFVDFTSVGAGPAAVNLRPDQGKQWRIMYAVGWHADAGAVNCAWYLTDIVGGGLPITPDISCAAAALQPIGSIATGGPTQCLGPLKATRDRYYSFVFAASAAAKHGYVRAIVEEYLGVNDA
jgi:hypothetical protein